MSQEFKKLIVLTDKIIDRLKANVGLQKAEAYTNLLGPLSKELNLAETQLNNRLNILMNNITLRENEMKKPPFSKFFDNLQTNIKKENDLYKINYGVSKMDMDPLIKLPYLAGPVFVDIKILSDQITDLYDKTNDFL